MIDNHAGSLQTDSAEHLSETRARGLLERVAAEFKKKPFIPHPIFKRGNAQTFAAHFWPGRFRPDHASDEARLFEVEPGTRILAYCRWHPQRADHPTLALWHGMEGSTASVYMLSTADKAFAAGFNVVRVNFRNCGGTEQLTPTLYHGGLTSDLRGVIAELIERDKVSRLFVVGFSLGGNMVLKLAGEYGENPPPEIKAIGAVSPSIHFRSSSNLIMERRNWIYHWEFVRTMKQRIRLKEKLFPDRYDLAALNRVRTLQQFEHNYIAPMFGFEGVDDYYAKASSLNVIPNIRIPTLMIHAEDDPFIPFAPLRDATIAANPYVMLIATKRGGHVAFVSTRSQDEDRFWAENRMVEFCRLADGA